MITAYIALAAAALFWSGNMLTGRALHAAVSPLGLAFWRWVLILLVLAPFVAAPLRRAWPQIRADWPLLMLLGLLSTGLFNALVFLALHHTSATNAALLNSSIPVWTALLGVTFARLRPAPVELAGLAVSLAGVLAIISRGEPTRLAALQINAGDALMLAGMVAWSVYALLLPRRPKALGPFSYLWITGAFGLPAVLAAAALQAWSAPQPDLLAVPRSAEAWAGIVYLALFPSILATAAYNHAIDRVGPLRAGQAVHLVPVFTALIAWALLGEAIEPFHVLGFALILGGLVLSGRHRG